VVDDGMASRIVNTAAKRTIGADQIRLAWVADEIFPRVPRAGELQTEGRPPLPLPMSSDDTVLDRISSFISENKRGVVIGAAAAAVAVGGVAYYVASSRAGPGSGDEESLRGAKKKDKKKRKHRKSPKDKDGPILEEKKPKATEESDDGQPLPVPTTTFDFCSLTDFYCGNRPITDGGTDPGARHRREYTPFPALRLCLPLAFRLCLFR